MLLWNLSFIAAANEYHCVSIDLTNAISCTKTTTQLDCAFELFECSSYSIQAILPIFIVLLWFTRCVLGFILLKMTINVLRIRDLKICASVQAIFK